MTKNNTLTVEQKIAQLEKTVAWFDSDEFALERAVDHYSQAQKLAAEIQHDISNLKNEIEQVGGTET